MDATPHVHRVPASLASLVGREWEISAGCDLLRRDGARLVTLSGPPGTGKTRLSLAIAEQLQSEWPHGACFVPLAAINDPALVIPAIAQALGVPEAADQSLLAGMQAYLSDKQLLLVLDNFEQVIDAAPFVAQLLEAAPRVKALISSREALKIYGEHEFPVPPLTVPPLKDQLLTEELKMYSALELFVQRAQAAQPKFTVTDDNVHTLIQICARLDGLPLAIEMAAARVKWIAPAALLEQLSQRLSTLTTPMRDRSPRQQTLRGAIDWSCDLLGEAERQVFELCGIFVGGFDLEAMNVVAGDYDSRACLQALVEKSLLKYDVDPEDVARYAMLETIHEYARGRLIAHDRFASAQRLHAAYYLAVAEQAESQVSGPEEQRALDRLEREHDNLRAALRWAIEQNDPADALRLCSALGSFWTVRGHWSEGQNWTERALARAPATPLDPEQQRLRANVLHVAARLAENRGHPTVTCALYEESLRLRQLLGDEAAIAEALTGLGRVASHQGDFAQARTYLEASIKLLRAAPHAAGLAAALNSLAYVANVQGSAAEARALCEESLALRRALDDQRGIATTLNSLGILAMVRGDYVTARSLLEESLTLRRKLGDRAGISSTLNNLGIVASEQRDFATAQKFYSEALALDRELADQHATAVMLINLGNVAYNLGNWTIAQDHFAEALAYFEQLNAQRSRATALNSLGNVMLMQGETETAHQFYQRSLTLRRDLGDQRGLLHSLASMAGWLSTNGLIERAVQLAGAVAALQIALELRLDIPEQQLCDRALTLGRAQLDEAAFQNAWTQGQALLIEQAAIYAVTCAGEM